MREGSNASLASCAAGPVLPPIGRARGFRRRTPISNRPPSLQVECRFDPALSPRSGRPSVPGHRNARAVVIRRPVPLATQTSSRPPRCRHPGDHLRLTRSLVRERRRSPEGPHHHGSGLAPPPVWSRRSPRFGWRATLPEGTFPSSGTSADRDSRTEGSSQNPRGRPRSGLRSTMVRPRRDVPWIGCSDRSIRCARSRDLIRRSLPTCHHVGVARRTVHAACPCVATRTCAARLSASHRPVALRGAAPHGHLPSAEAWGSEPLRRHEGAGEPARCRPRVISDVASSRAHLSVRAGFPGCETDGGRLPWGLGPYDASRSGQRLMPGLPHPATQRLQVFSTS